MRQDLLKVLHWTEQNSTFPLIIENFRWNFQAHNWKPSKETFTCCIFAYIVNFNYQPRTHCLIGHQEKVPQLGHTKKMSKPEKKPKQRILWSKLSLSGVLNESLSPRLVEKNNMTGMAVESVWRFNRKREWEKWQLCPFFF